MAMGPMGGRGMRPAEKSKRGLRGVQRELFSYSERIKLPMLIALVLALIAMQSRKMQKQAR